MNRRTWTLIGAAVAVMGLGLVALGLAQDEATVRFVEDIADAPRDHRTGTYTLLGIPQPARMPVPGDEAARMDNPEFRNETRTTTAWHDGETLYHTVHVLRSETVEGGLRFIYRNETRAPLSGERVPAHGMTWSWPGVQAFPVQAFADGDDHTPRIWAVYAGVEPTPIQPKPSQFVGRAATTAPDGTALPDEVALFIVEEYVAQCSSKFLPPEEQRAQEAADTAGEGRAATQT